MPASARKDLHTDKDSCQQRQTQEAAQARWADTMNRTIGHRRSGTCSVTLGPDSSGPSVVDVGLRCSGYGRQRAPGTVVLVHLRDDPLSAEKAAVAAVADSGWDVGRGAEFEVSRVEFGHARREVKRVDAGVSDAEDDDVDPVG